jgi:hypothetical protein
MKDGRSLIVQRQSRDQKRLDYLRVDAATGAAILLFSDTSRTWINLSDDLKPLGDGSLSTRPSVVATATCTATPRVAARSSHAAIGMWRASWVSVKRPEGSSSSPIARTAPNTSSTR